MAILKHKTAIVTGAGQGVGRGIALALAAEGAAVVLVGRTRSKLDAVAAEVAERGGRAAAHACDIKDPAAIEACVAFAAETYGGVDILVNNAQEVALGYLLELSDEEVQAGWESGPMATLRFMRACHPHMRAAGGGAVVNLGSRAAVRPDPIRRGAYAAVKEAIRAFSRAAAWEMAPDGIRVNTILPLATSPALEANAETNPDEYARTLSAIPLGRLGDPEADIGRAVVFLVGPDAGYITGTSLPLDGGAAYVR